MSVDMMERSVGGYDGSGDAKDWEAWTAETTEATEQSGTKTYGRGYVMRHVGGSSIAGVSPGVDPNALRMVMPRFPTFVAKDLGWAAVSGGEEQ